MNDELRYVYVVKNGEWSDKYQRFVYPAFQDLNTHSDLASGVENRWHAEKYMRFDDVQKLRMEWEARLHTATEMLESLRGIANIAHHGGLIGYNTSAKAMSAICELSQRWWDREECGRLQRRRRTQVPPNTQANRTNPRSG